MYILSKNINYLVFYMFFCFLDNNFCNQILQGMCYRGKTMEMAWNVLILISTLREIMLYMISSVRSTQDRYERK